MYPDIKGLPVASTTWELNAQVFEREHAGSRAPVRVKTGVAGDSTGGSSTNLQPNQALSLTEDTSSSVFSPTYDPFPAAQQAARLFCRFKGFLRT